VIEVQEATEPKNYLPQTDARERGDLKRIKAKGRRIKFYPLSLIL
jgi:hypothetical protein